MIVFVYILQSETTGSYYIGDTQDVENRLHEHNTGETASTRNKGPWSVRFIQESPSLQVAKKIELKLKQLKRRDIITQIITEGIIKMK